MLANDLDKHCSDVCFSYSEVLPYAYSNKAWSDHFPDLIKNDRQWLDLVQWSIDSATQTRSPPSRRQSCALWRARKIESNDREIIVVQTRSEKYLENFYSLFLSRLKWSCSQILSNERIELIKRKNQGRILRNSNHCANPITIQSEHEWLLQGWESSVSDHTCRLLLVRRPINLRPTQFNIDKTGLQRMKTSLIEYWWREDVTIRWLICVFFQN